MHKETYFRSLFHRGQRIPANFRPEHQRSLNLIGDFQEMITHKTRGLVLRSVKYGETSMIVAIYTEIFGIQSYLANGVRKSSKRGSGMANLLQPAAMLDMVVYQNQFKNLQRIKEFRYAIIYEHIFFDIFKNAVALFMVELLMKSIKQPEPNPDLFDFIDDAFQILDRAQESVVANFPLFFSLHLAGFFGFRIQDDYSEVNSILDLEEGSFVSERPHHIHYIEEPLSFHTSQLLKTMKPEELEQLRLNQETRRHLLHSFINFYALHISDFGSMKTIPVLQTVFSE
jgi:DNA repair protein RecO (recombination protein O)